jgi:hypothetical protein
MLAESKTPVNSPSVTCDVLGTSKSRHCTRIFMSRRYLRPLVDKLEDELVTCSDMLLTSL